MYFSTTPDAGLHWYVRFFFKEGVRRLVRLEEDKDDIDWGDPDENDNPDDDDIDEELLDEEES